METIKQQPPGMVAVVESERWAVVNAVGSMLRQGCINDQGCCVSELY